MTTLCENLSKQERNHVREARQGGVNPPQGEVRYYCRAGGVNRANTHTRRYYVQWGEVTPPKARGRPYYYYGGLAGGARSRHGTTTGG